MATTPPTEITPIINKSVDPPATRVECYRVRPIPQSYSEAPVRAELRDTVKGRWSSLPWAFRSSWQRLLRHDTAFIFSHLPSLFNTAARSIFTKPRVNTEQYNPSVRSKIGGYVMLLISGVLTIPIAATLIVALPSYLLLSLTTSVAEKLQGAPLRRSQSVGDSPPEARFVPGYQRESWLFVNGIATAPSGAQATVNYLETLVKRPVTAILNRTYGAWFDLWECFIQRDMHLNTNDIRDGYKILVRHVTDMSKERIVLIGHSQGGILVSAWVDQLLADFDEDILSRVEVYTFASAANHFSRGGRYIVENGVVKDLDPPKCSKGAVDGENPTVPANGPFRFVEHFANTGDFVAQLGVLSHKPTAGGGPETFGVFAGQIFEREQEGHGILDYYLGLGTGQTSILDIERVRNNSRLASYVVKDGRDGSPLFDA